MLLGVLLHHVADVHLAVACGDLEPGGRLRTLLNVAQLSGAPAVHGLVAHLGASPTFVVLHLQPIGASIFNVADSKDRIQTSLIHDLRRHFHVHVMLGHQDIGSLGRKIHDEHTLVGGSCVLATLVVLTLSYSLELLGRDGLIDDFTFEKLIVHAAGDVRL